MTCLYISCFVSLLVILLFCDRRLVQSRTVKQSQQTFMLTRGIESRWDGIIYRLYKTGIECKSDIVKLYSRLYNISCECNCGLQKVRNKCVISSPRLPLVIHQCVVSSRLPLVIHQSVSSTRLPLVIHQCVSSTRLPLVIHQSVSSARLPLVIHQYSVGYLRSSVNV